MLGPDYVIRATGRDASGLGLVAFEGKRAFLALVEELTSHRLTDLSMEPWQLLKWFLQGLEEYWNSG